MLFLLSANVLIALIVSADARPPMALNPNVVRYIAIPQQFVEEESHPFEIVAEAPRAGVPLEVSDDDQYENSAPAGVVAAVPVNLNSKPKIYRVVDRDLTASASDLQAAASGHGHGGWLDMGAYSSGKGAFGWYADYPVGGGHW